jgi:hypothetical protein
VDTAISNKQEMEKTMPTDVAQVERTAESENGDKVEAKIAADTSLEQELSVKYMLKHHKKLIAWTFFWATCAIGWGFDAQGRVHTPITLSSSNAETVNGAMISVPSFRRDFG